MSISEELKELVEEYGGKLTILLMKITKI